MAINFPNAPVQGQVYEYGDYRYTFDGVKWTSVVKYGSSAVKIQSATPPGAPEPGLQWFDDETGRTYFWHINDGTDQGQWVEDAPQGVVERSLEESIGDYTNHQASSVADMIVGKTVGGQTVNLEEGQIWTTSGRINSGDGGGDEYLISSHTTYNTLVGNSNGPTALGNGGDGTNAYFDVVLTGDLIAYKSKRNIVFTEQLCNISDPSAVAGAFVASGHYGGKLYHFADVTANFITIDGAARDWKLRGSGKLTLADNQDNMSLRIDNCTGFMSIKGVKLDGNKFNQNPSSRNLGAGLRFFNCTAGYEAVRVEVKNNNSGAGILVIDNATDLTEFDVPVCRIAYCDVRDCGDTSFVFSSDGIFANSDRCDIYGNIVDNVTDFAIALDYSKNMRVYNNRCYNFLVGVGVLGVQDLDLYSNIFDGGEIGIDVTLAGNPATPPYISNGVKIHDNFVKNTTTPGGLSGDGISIDPSATSVEVYNNTIDQFLGRGVACTSNDAKVYDNTVIGTTGQTAYFIGGSRSRFIDNESRDAAGNSLIHNIASDVVVIDDKNSTYQRTSRTVTPSIGSATRVAYLRATGTDAAALLILRVAQQYPGLGTKIVERRLRCDLNGNTFSFGQLSVIGDSTDIILTASPLAAGQAEITINVTAGTSTSATVQLEIISVSESGLGTIYISDRL